MPRQKIRRLNERVATPHRTRGDSDSDSDRVHSPSDRRKQATKVSSRAVYIGRLNLVPARKGCVPLPRPLPDSDDSDDNDDDILSEPESDREESEDEGQMTDRERLNYKNKMFAALEKDADLALLQKHGIEVETLSPDAPPTYCKMAHVMEVRTHQEVWVNSVYRTPQICQTTILISAEVVNGEFDEKIKEAYNMGANIVAHWDPEDLDGEIFLLESFVSQDVIILRRNVIVEKGHLWDASAPVSMQHHMCDVYLVNEYCGADTRRRAQLDIVCRPFAHRTANSITKCVSFQFVFRDPSKPCPTVRPISRQFKKPKTKDGIYFESAVATKAGYVDVHNQYTVYKDEEEGFLGKENLSNFKQFLSHSAQFLWYGEYEKGDLHMLNSDAKIVRASRTNAGRRVTRHDYSKHMPGYAKPLAPPEGEAVRK